MSGFDLLDDGRAVALVDWDHDGDTDVWIANRNGPQLRLLLNQSDAGRHFVAVSLQGSTSNRDAIGARVELWSEPDSTQPISRTLRAGDGFLAQSSKRLLFGLGDASRIDRIVVHWPGGQAETFSASQVDCHYHLVEGRGQVQVIDRPRRVANLVSDRLPSPPETAAVRSLCFSMIRLPVQDYLNLQGDLARLLDGDARLVLVNLWASWCPPCLGELQDFVTHQQRLRDRGIDVVALSVDATASAEAAAGADLQWLKQVEFPFRSGRADERIVEKLQLLSDTIFELKRPLPIPTSFLIDKKGRVVAVYKGPVTADQLLTDADRLKVRTTEQWRKATLPFEGRWEMPPRRRHLFNFVEQLADRGYLQESRLYVQQNREMLTTHPRWPELSRKINVLGEPPASADGPGRPGSRSLAPQIKP